MTAPMQPMLPTAHAGDFNTSAPPLDILGLTLNAYGKAQELMRRPQVWQQEDEDRANRQQWQQQLQQRQQTQWSQQDADRQYAIGQRPVQEQMQGLHVAQMQAGLATTNANLARTTLGLQTQTADAAFKQEAINQMNTLARGQNINPAQGRITSYGYAGDDTPDGNSSLGIGAFVSDAEAQRIKNGEATPNKLQAGDIALSPDTRQTVTAAGIQPGEPFTLHFADGSTHTGRYMDHTADSTTDKSGNTVPVRNRFDLYSPNGPDKRNDQPVVGFSRAAPGLPNADQLDRMMQIATATKDPAIMGRAQQINDANSLRPDIQAQRNGKAWNSGFQYWQNRLATLPSDVTERMSNIAGVSPTNPNTLPALNQPQMWGGINQRLDGEIASYNKDPATWRRVQLDGQPRTPVLPKAATLTPSSLSHLITNPDTPPELKNAAQDAYARIIADWVQRSLAPPAKTAPSPTVPATAPPAAPAIAAPAAKPPGSVPPLQAKADPTGWQKLQKLIGQ